MARYTLYQQGPDNRSTFAECWGSNAGPGREIATADRLGDLVEAADQYDHQNWSIRDHHRRETITPDEFWARKCVQKARPKREE